MPYVEQSHRYQTVVLWPRVGDDLYGQAVLGSAVELQVRWDGSSQEVRGPQGKPITIDATAVVDRVIPIGSAVWLGSLDDLPGTSLLPEVDVMYVYSYKSTPDVRNRNVFRQIQLMRSRNTING